MVHKRIRRPKLTVTPGYARDLTARIVYMSPDGRAIVVSVDTNTKYLEYSYSSHYEGDSVPTSMELMLMRGESTLRAGRSKSHGTVSLKPPIKAGKRQCWTQAFSGGRYGGLWHLALV